MTRWCRIAVLALLACLALLPLSSEAGFRDARIGRFQVIEKEVSYRSYAEKIPTFETALVTKEGWIAQTAQPFAAPRGPFELWAKFDLPEVSTRRQVFINSSPWDRVELFVLRDGRLEDRS